MMKKNDQRKFRFENSARNVAIRNGEIKYIGRRCEKCGGSERYASVSTCVNCAKNLASETQRRIKTAINKIKQQTKSNEIRSV
jgi:uncharacterized OB-fold protein